MKTVVIGGGFAGLAAAITLQERRHQVVLLERRGVLGGRASSYRDARSGEDVDNGTHLMVAAYTATLELARRAGACELFVEQQDLRIEWAGDRERSAFACPPLPAPLHLLAGLLGLRAPLRERLQALRLGPALQLGGRPDGLTVAQFLERSGQGAAVRRLLWDPLALAMLNAPPEQAAAVLFWRVCREAFLHDRRRSRLVFLRRGWGVLVERLGRYFESRGGCVRRGAHVERLALVDGRAGGVHLAQRPGNRNAIAAGEPAQAAVEPADAVVSAVPPEALAKLVPGERRAPFSWLDRFGGSPIVSVDLWLDRQVVDRVMLGLRECELDWVFDKGRLFGRTGEPQHLAFIASAAERAASRTNAELVASAEAALRRCFPAMAGAKVVRSLVLRERRATFLSSPELEALRPGPETPIPGLFLAGDWTGTGLPATIEGAVRSGVRAAEAVIAYERRGAAASSSASG